MTLGAPDPTWTVPLPLRDQAAVRDRWLSQRLLDVLPGLMDRADIDLWLVVGREYNEDPVLGTLLPAAWLSARRRTILALQRSDDGVVPIAVSDYPVGQFLAAIAPEDSPVPPGIATEWDEVRRIVEQADPTRIGIDVSPSFALADGLSHAEHQSLISALGPYADRCVPAESLAIGWLETRLPEEIQALRTLNRLAHDVVSEAFTAVEVGTTTALDVAWWIRQRLADLGVDPWFQPGVTLQRAGVPLVGHRGTLMPSVRFDAVIEPGDVLHCDVGLSSLGLRTDTQRTAYVLRADESEPPAGLCAAMATANRLQDLTLGSLTAGRTGNEVLAAARAAAAAEGIDGDVYSHPVGYHGHGAGPAIGQWDRQDGIPGPGDYPVHVNTVYALELAIREPVPEWDGQVVRMAVEDGIALTGDGVGYLAERQTELIPIR
jgi:Xaa-Pro aminopeptidase